MAHGTGRSYFTKRTNMEQIVVDQNLIMLDGKPLALVSKSGIAKWESAGIETTPVVMMKSPTMGTTKASTVAYMRKRGHPRLFFWLCHPLTQKASA